MTFQMKVRIDSVGQYEHLGYGVGKKSLTFPRSKFVMPKTTTASSLTLASNTLTIRYEACNTNIVIGFLPGAGFFVTQNEFATIQFLKADLPDTTAGTVKDFVVTKSYVVFLMNSGEVYELNQNNTSGSLKKVPGLENLQGIKSSSWCLTGSHDDSRDFILAWNQTNFITGPPHKPYALNVPEYFSAGSENVIVDAVFDAVPGKKAFVVLAKSMTAYFLHYVPYPDIRGLSSWTQMGPAIADNSTNATLNSLLGGALTVITAASQAIYQVLRS